MALSTDGAHMKIGLMVLLVGMQMLNIVEAAKYNAQTRSISYQSSLPDFKSENFYSLWFTDESKSLLKDDPKCFINLKICKDGIKNEFTYSDNCARSSISPFRDVSSFVSTGAYQYQGKIGTRQVQGKIDFKENTVKPLPLAEKIEFYQTDKESVAIRWSPIPGAKSYELYICKLDGWTCGGYSNGLTRNNMVIVPLWGIQEENYGKQFRFVVRAYSFDLKDWLGKVNTNQLRASIDLGVT